MPFRQSDYGLSKPKSSTQDFHIYSLLLHSSPPTSWRPIRPTERHTGGTTSSYNRCCGFLASVKRSNSWELLKLFDATFFHTLTSLTVWLTYSICPVSDADLELFGQGRVNGPIQVLQSIKSINIRLMRGMSKRRPTHVWHTIEWT